MTSAHSKRTWVVHHEPYSPLYGLASRIEYPSAEMAQAAAEGLRHSSSWARIWVEERSA